METDPPLPGQPGGARQISPDHVALGRAIRDARAAIGISQETLAERAGLHRTYVGGIERGERNVSFGNLLKLTRALGIRPSELLHSAEALDALAAGHGGEAVTGRRPPGPSQ